ncbi:MAG: sensor histidine kinase [Gelidibacter sp.]|nr:sensor histidine kinase [Gelidibacter sp.]
MKDLSLHILDILQNSIFAEAKLIKVDIYDSNLSGTLKFTISDDGKGMDDEILNKITDPFYTTRTTRKVGLGIPLLKQNCEQTGGSLSIYSTINKGTSIEALFYKNHFDMLPLGDISGVISLTFSSWSDIDFEYSHKTDFGNYVLNTKEIKETLENIPINNPQVIKFMKQMIEENLQEINAI